jgi:beta-galactosidase
LFYAIDDLDPAPEKAQHHAGELQKRNEIYLHLDDRQTGMGGIDSWGAMPLEQYRVAYGTYQYTYTIQPIY